MTRTCFEMDEVEQQAEFRNLGFLALHAAVVEERLDAFRLVRGLEDEAELQFSRSDASAQGDGFGFTVDVEFVIPPFRCQICLEQSLEFQFGGRRRCARLSGRG